MNPAVVAIGLTLLALLVAGVILNLRRERRTRLFMPPPLLLAVVVLLVLGLVIAPRLFGFAFLFLPLLWIRRPRPGGREAEDEEGREGRDPWWDPWDGDR